ncbi:hypothetical protein QTP88_003470 [Uroleucon formosanum]
MYYNRDYISYSGGRSSTYTGKSEFTEHAAGHLLEFVSSFVLDPTCDTNRPLLNEVNSEGYKKIEGIVKKTFPTCNINKIHQVYAPQMYGMYLLHKKEMELNVNQTISEKLLFHVTSESRAIKSLNSGLDWRLTRRAKFGCGVSFSDDIDYANYYADNSCIEGILCKLVNGCPWVDRLRDVSASHGVVVGMKTMMNNQRFITSEVEECEESDNFIQDPGEKSTNALILFSSGFGPYQPNNIIFPQHSGRKFRPEWYSSFPWIEYSPSSNSAFCFYCRAFPSNTSDPTFVSVGFKQWSKASYKSFPQHEKSFRHKEASAKLAGYKSSKKSGSIISKVNTHHQQIVADNRAYLKCILDSLLYCARQGIAVRGHREDEDSSNKGNFLELLTLRANDNDIIQRYFIEKEKTFRYVSGDYTNTFLEYLANIVIKNIIDNVIAAGIFSIIVDETQDLSRHEQVAIIIRYATKDLSPAEVFLGFYETETTDGETLSMLIKSTFVSHGLKIENIRGQCYDGAASMRGSYKGVQARIREENHLAMYIHCNAHILNLCLIDLAKQVSYVRNVFGTLNTLHNFIGASSKRHAIFEKMYSVLNVNALKAVLLNFQTVVSTLEDISENDAVYGSDANALLKSINTFEFLFCIYFLKNIMLLTNVLSKYLQSSSIIYSNVQSMAKVTIQELCNMRCEESFNNTWNEVDILRKQYNVSSPILPRKQKIPAKLGGGLKEVENTTINKHYKINIYFAVLDNIINDMGERFEENNLYVLNCMQDILLNDMPNNNSFKEINKMYGFDEDNLKAETTILNRMYKTVHDQNNVQSKINFIASENYKAGFPTLTRLIQLFITVPTNSASCERSFSCLRRLKTYLRTTMGQSRLNSHGILQIERERSSLIDKDEVIDKFSAAAECRGRRLLLQ